MNLRIFLLLASLSTCVALAFTYLELPSRSLFWSAVQNSGHAFVFAGLALIFLWLFHAHLKRSLPFSVALAFAGLELLGFIIELAQHATGRGASISDVFMNTVGIVGGGSLYLAACLIRERRKVGQAIAAFILSGACLAWSLQWPFLYLVSATQRPHLPLLTDFEHLAAHLYVSGNGSTQSIAEHASWTANGTQSLRVTFQPGRWPNVAFLEPEANWSGYSQISFIGYNPQETPLVLSIRIDEQALGPLDDDRMTVKRTVPSGDFAVTIPFDEFRANAARRGRPGIATFERINGYVVFVAGVESTLVLYFDNFKLE